MKNVTPEFAASQEVIIQCKDKDIRDLIFKPGYGFPGTEEYSVKSEKGDLLLAMERRQRVILKDLDLAIPGTLGILRPIFSLLNNQESSVTLRDPRGGSPVFLQAANFIGFDASGIVTDPDKLPNLLHACMGKRLIVQEKPKPGPAPVFAPG